MTEKVLILSTALESLKLIIKMNLVKGEYLNDKLKEVVDAIEAELNHRLS